MTPTFKYVEGATALLFEEAGDRRRLVQIRPAGRHRGARAIGTRFLPPPLDTRDGRVHVSMPTEDRDWLEVGALVEGFFVLNGESYAFEASVEAVAGGEVVVAPPRIIMSVLRRRFRRILQRGAEVVAVLIEDWGAGARPGCTSHPAKQPLKGVLQDLSVGGLCACVSARAAGRDTTIDLLEGEAYWLTFRLGGEGAESVRLPAVLRHVKVDDKAVMRRLRCGLQFALDLAPPAETAAIRSALDAVARYVEEADVRNIFL